MKYLKLTNPTAISKEEIELFGYSDKRNNSDLIGEKGTGLKFSRLQALRQGIETFICTSDFKNSIKTEDLICTTKRIIFSYENKNKRKKNVKSSYTTEGGVGDWKDSWFIVREFVQNARDEFVRANLVKKDEAMSLTLKTLEVVGSVEFAEKGKTSCYIEITPKIEKVFSNIGRYFVFNPDFDCHVGSIYFSKEKNIYKQGIFVDEIKINKSCFASYDYFGVDLNESRTLKYSQDVWEGAIAILNHAPIDMKKDFLIYVKDNFHNDECSQAWSHNKFFGEGWGIAFVQLFGENSVIHNHETVTELDLEKLQSKKLNVVPVHEKMYECLKENGIKTLEDVNHIDSKNEFEIIDISGKEKERLSLAKQMCETIFGKFDIEVFLPRNNEQIEMLGCWSNVSQKIYINNGILTSEERILDTLVEEYIHATSGAGDFSRAFQSFACQKIRELLIRRKVVSSDIPF